jgi:uncharacterized protein (TIGR03067 family)
MTRYGITLLTVGLVLVIGQARADDKEDKEKAQGAWTQVGREIVGISEKIDENHRDHQTLKVEGNKWQINYKDRNGKWVLRGTFAIDSSKNPKTIDITVTSLNGVAAGGAGICLEVYL